MTNTETVLLEIEAECSFHANGAGIILEVHFNHP